MNPLSSPHKRLFYRQLATVLALTLSLVSFSAQAEKLTDNTIRSFITTLEEAQSLELKELNDKEDTEAVDMSRIFSSSVENLKGKEAYGRLERLVKNNGFSNLNQWAATGDRIYGAWMAIEMEGQSPGFNQEMQKALADLENDPHMSDQQKAQMRSVMETAAGTIQMASQAPSADIEAVRPHLKALRAAGNVEDN